MNGQQLMQRDYETCDETQYDENCLITKYINKDTIGEIVFSNEIVFRGHPDKICDQISAAILKECVKQDKNTRAGIEVMGGKYKIFITGEITTNAKYNITRIVQNTLKDIGCENELDYEIIDNIGKQSIDINMGVDKDNEIGAGDNGVMFGYATRETMQLLPLAQVILQEFAIEYDKLVHSGIHYENYSSCFKPDGKAQITGLYSNDFRLKKILTFTICYQNIEKPQSREITDNMLKQIAKNICNKYNIVIDRFLINPTGKFEIGSFVGDAGLTGRKIVVDAYQGFANVGGGNQNGKDCSKVDFSGSHKARELAKRFLMQNDLKWCKVQLSYSIGIAEPMAIYIETNEGIVDTSEMKELYSECKPQNIINDLKLLDIDYVELAKFGHFR